MLYEVDFAISMNGIFQTVHTALIFADSVSDCKKKAKSIRDEFSKSKQDHIQIFIEA